MRAETDADGALVWLRFLAARRRCLRIERVGQELRGERAARAGRARTEMKSGEIHSSLFGATDAAGIPDSVAIQLADMFGSDIDFHRELRQGDRFSVVYEIAIVDGRPLRAGACSPPSSSTRARTHRALWLRRRGGYYAPDGKNMRKALLRSPLEFSRVSSGLPACASTRSCRPGAPTRAWITRRRPARACARSATASSNSPASQGGYGNMVDRPARRSAYSTRLRAPDGFGRGIRNGARVAQGDTIGTGRPDRLGDRAAPALRIPRRGRSSAIRCPWPCPPATPVARHGMDAFRAKHRAAVRAAPPARSLRASSRAARRGRAVAADVHARELYVGLMSGTSLDGVDAVLADFVRARRPACWRTRIVPFDAGAASANCWR